MQEFNSEFFKSAGNLVKWYPTFGIVRIAKKVIGEIKLYGDPDCYGYIVSIIHTGKGVTLSSCSFLFDSYLMKRNDDDTLYSGGFIVARYKWYSGGFIVAGCKWYRAIPSNIEIKKMVDVMFDYMGNFE